MVAPGRGVWLTLKFGHTGCGIVPGMLSGAESIDAGRSVGQLRRVLQVDVRRNPYAKPHPPRNTVLELI